MDFIRLCGRLTACPFCLPSGIPPARLKPLFFCCVTPALTMLPMYGVFRIRGGRRNSTSKLYLRRWRTGISATPICPISADGGRNRKDGEPSPNTLWREEGFRNYADYAETPAFHAAFDELLKLAQTKHVAIMCAEALWWQCHRRIITDYLIASGAQVEHILENKIEPCGTFDRRRAASGRITPSSTATHRCSINSPIAPRLLQPAQATT